MLSRNGSKFLAIASAILFVILRWNLALNLEDITDSTAHIQGWIDTEGVELYQSKVDCKDVIYMADTRLPTEEFNF